MKLTRNLWYFGENWYVGALKKHCKKQNATEIIIIPTIKMLRPDQPVFAASTPNVLLTSEPYK